MMFGQTNNPFRTLGLAGAPTWVGRGPVDTRDVTGEQSFLQRALAMLAEQRRYRQTLRELRSLNDHELADIGVERCDIAAIARLSASQHA